MSFLINQVRALRDRVIHPVARVGRLDCNIQVPHLILGSPDYHTFIGYYDIQPFNKDNSKLLAGRCPASHNGRAMDIPLEIGYYNLKTQYFTTIGSTSLWCWQMGCRLQWVNWDGQELILYNDLIDYQPKTILFDSDKGEVHTTLPVPTYAISPDSIQIISLDFNNLEQCRSGYGYDWKKGASHESEAELTLYNVEKDKQETLVTKRHLQSINQHSSMDEEDTVHYFNHIHFNPSGTRILFFHIWNASNKRHVRALTINPDGSDIKDVTGGDHVSHYWWLNDHEILLYCTDPKHGLGYHIYDQNGEHIRQLKNEIPVLDGHPRSHQPPWFICDNVVNKYFERDLWLYNLETECRVPLAQLYSPPQFSGSIRCDLHPRLSQNGHCVAVDSAHAGYRQIVVLDIEGIL